MRWVLSLISMRDGERWDPSPWVIKRATYPLNSSPYWGLLGAEINAVAYGAGAQQIKPLSAVPGLKEQWDHTVHTGHKQAASSAHLEAAVKMNSSKEPVPCLSASLFCWAHNFLPQHRKGKANILCCRACPASFASCYYKTQDKGGSDSSTHWTVSISSMMLWWLVTKSG